MDDLRRLSEELGGKIVSQIEEGFKTINGRRGSLDAWVEQVEVKRGLDKREFVAVIEGIVMDDMDEENSQDTSLNAAPNRRQLAKAAGDVHIQVDELAQKLEDHVDASRDGLAAFAGKFDALLLALKVDPRALALAAGPDAHVQVQAAGPDPSPGPSRVASSGPNQLEDQPRPAGASGQSVTVTRRSLPGSGSSAVGTSRVTAESSDGSRGWVRVEPGPDVGETGPSPSDGEMKPEAATHRAGGDAAPPVRGSDSGSDQRLESESGQGARADEVEALNAASPKTVMTA